MADMRDTGLIRGDSEWRNSKELAMFWDMEAARSYIGTCAECGDEATVVQLRDHQSGDLVREPAPRCKQCFEGWCE